MAVNADPEKGGYASGYLNRWQKAAWLKAAEEADMPYWTWVQLAVLEKLVVGGYLPKEDVERTLEKLETRKRKKAAGEPEPAKKGQTEKALMTPAQRAEARRVRREKARKLVDGRLR